MGFLNKYILLVTFALLNYFFTSHAHATEVDEPGGYATLDQLTVIFGNIVSIVVGIGGILAFIALIIGGFRYMTARGDPKALSSAQGMLLWAIVGLVLIIISWLIIQFIAQFTGLDITKFCVGSNCPKF